MKFLTLGVLSIAAITRAGQVISATNSVPRPPTPFISPPSRDFDLAAPNAGVRQSFEEAIPRCCWRCIDRYVQKHTKCGYRDFECICNYEEVSDENAVRCAVDACGFSKAKNVIYPSIKKFCGLHMQPRYIEPVEEGHDKNDSSIFFSV